jgi:hypothetical protein
MRAKTFVTLLILTVLSVFVFVSGAQASLGAVYTVDGLFSAISSGDLDSASAMFAPDAVASQAMTNQLYEGADEIGILLEKLHGEGREYEIVQLEMLGNTVNLTADIADDGHVWGRQTMTVEVQNGLIQSFEIIETHLTLWRIMA